MNFNSLEFLVIFLPAVFFLFYSAPARMRLPVLAGASIVFYGVSGGVVLAAFVVAILWAYATAFLFSKWPKALATITAVCLPAFFLIMFKYLDFLLNAVHAGPDIRDHLWIFYSVLLPAGISFYTFELVSYSVDVADGKIPPDSDLVRFTSFVTFFPHLIAGPIMRYANLRDQLQSLRDTPTLQPRIDSALKLLSIGLFFKIFVADICGMAVSKAERIPLDQLTASDQLTQIVFWSMQIYYDFWAYSVMAIGLGRLFCIELPVNFREPYLSENPREFWQRWNITLSYWLRDYVYIKMGGRENYIRNILIVFALVGLWHGAGWNFVVWGIYHGTLVVAYHFTRGAWDRLPAPLAICLTFTLVSFGWPLFFMSLDQYAAYIEHFLSAPWNNSVYGPAQWLYLAAIGVVTFGLREKLWLYNDPGGRPAISDSPVLLASLMFAGLLTISLSRTFIYFRF